ncbi:hypothetical protein NG798_26270 [Ancylothrix sp. C2]|uniref:hypothetical protein n=1 Tax=Ancylothrix sp. D3o TaxID=2953691 RepID=UPI0021BAF233|nr:hypothetical protein [Ancylothrix sp. D3o]MCT7953309.1 hypothetical protein [Ancylothrix sp. D3o]
MAARKDERIVISPLGEYYDDVLTVDAWINNRSKANQANNLLCSKLQEREKKIEERIAYLATKRGITPTELWWQILRGEAQRIDPTDIAKPVEQEETV